MEQQNLAPMGKTRKKSTPFYNGSSKKKKKRKKRKKIDDYTDPEDPCNLRSTKRRRTMKVDNKEIYGFEESSLPNTNADLQTLLCMDESSASYLSNAVNDSTITTRTLIKTMIERAGKAETRISLNGEPSLWAANWTPATAKLMEDRMKRSPIPNLLHPEPPVLSKPPANYSSCESSFNKTITEVLPRIGYKLSMAQLTEEAVCRGFAKEELPKSKADLLHFLLDGSIHLNKTKAWKEINEIINQMELEKAMLYQRSLQQKLAREQKKADRKKSKEEKVARMHEKIRREEKAKQKKLHMHSFPRIHVHLLAKTCELAAYGIERGIVACCAIYDANKDFIYTCEECDFDICRTCFEYENHTNLNEESAELDCLQSADIGKQRRGQQTQLGKQCHEQECKGKICWSASDLFAKHIIHPPEKNKKPDGNNMKGFTVWCSDGPDGRHSFNPEKEFDSTWESAKEANERARYLFFLEKLLGYSSRRA